MKKKKKEIQETYDSFKSQLLGTSHKILEMKTIHHFMVAKNYLKNDFKLFEFNDLNNTSTPELILLALEYRNLSILKHLLTLKDINQLSYPTLETPFLFYLFTWKEDAITIKEMMIHLESNLPKDKSINFDIENNKGVTLISYLINNNNFELLEFLKNKNINWNYINKFGSNYLHQACGVESSIKIIDFLVKEKKFDVNQYSGLLSNPLHININSRKNLENKIIITKYLIDSEADPYLSDYETGANSFFLSINTGILDLVKIITDKHPQIVNSTIFKNDVSGLDLAIILNNQEIAKYLLEQKINLNKYSNNPLITSIITKNEEMTSLLLPYYKNESKYQGLIANNHQLSTLETLHKAYCENSYFMGFVFSEILENTNPLLKSLSLYNNLRQWQNLHIEDAVFETNHFKYIASPLFAKLFEIAGEEIFGCDHFNVDDTMRFIYKAEFYKEYQMALNKNKEISTVYKKFGSCYDGHRELARYETEFKDLDGKTIHSLYQVQCLLKTVTIDSNGALDKIYHYLFGNVASALANFLVMQMRYNIDIKYNILIQSIGTLFDLWRYVNSETIEPEKETIDSYYKPPEYVKKLILLPDEIKSSYNSFNKECAPLHSYEKKLKESLASEPGLTKKDLINLKIRREECLEAFNKITKACDDYCYKSIDKTPFCKNPMAYIHNDIIVNYELEFRKDLPEGMCFIRKEEMKSLEISGESKSIEHSEL